MPKYDVAYKIVMSDLSATSTGRRAQKNFESLLKDRIELSLLGKQVIMNDQARD